MGNIKYSDLIREVLPFLAANPSNPVTENMIKRAAIEFCAGSMVWKHIPDAMDVDANEPVYDIDVPSGSEVSCVISVILNGDPILPKSIDWLNNNVPTWNTTPSQPLYFAQTEPGQIILAPTPSDNVAAAMNITVALQPSQNSTSFPKWIFSRFAYAIADGAVAKLMLIPNKPWTDLASGEYRLNQFNAAIASARATAAHGLNRAPIRTKSVH